jgi:hypothetical protein
MEEVLLRLLHDLATSQDLLSVNLAAGVAYERLLALKPTSPKEDAAPPQRVSA